MDFFHSTYNYKQEHLWCSVKKVFLKILQKSQESTSGRVSFLINFQVDTVEFSTNCLSVFDYFVRLVLKD